MERNENNTDTSSKEIINKIQFFMQSKNIEKLNDFHPNCHRIQSRMRWFKGIRNTCFKLDIAA